MVDDFAKLWVLMLDKILNPLPVIVESTIKNEPQLTEKPESELTKVIKANAKPKRNARK